MKKKKIGYTKLADLKVLISVAFIEIENESRVFVYGFYETELHSLQSIDKYTQT